MFMGNASITRIEGRGKFTLKLTSRKDLVLSEVLHVPSLTENLVFGPILSKKGFKVVFESDKFVITKGGAYDGKGCLHEGLFKISLVNNDAAIVYKENKASTNTTYVFIVDPSFLSHS